MTGVVRTIRLSKRASDLLDANNNRHGDLGYYASESIIQYFDSETGKQLAPAVIKAPVKRFTPPGLSEAQDYFVTKGSSTNEASKFISFYESKGWMVGKNKMKSWSAAANNWISRNKEQASKPQGYQTAREKSATRNAEIFDYEKATRF